jgi:hypothetical protein
VRAFSPEEIGVVSEAVEIAEEVTADYFKLSTSQWKQLRYDIQTLVDLNADEIMEAAFAQITRYSRHPVGTLEPTRQYDHFKICLQDHSIVAAVERDETVRLLPLTIYVVTHELVHVVRFCKFLQRFDADFLERQREEVRVHEITHRALRDLNVPHLDHVLQAYRGYRLMEAFREGGTSP